MTQNLNIDENGNTVAHHILLNESPMSENSRNWLLQEVIQNPEININQENQDGLRYIDLIVMHKELCHDLNQDALLIQLKSRKDVDVGPNKFGDTPLHYAAHVDNFSGLIFLNQFPKTALYVNTQNDQGLTAMHVATSGMKLKSMMALKQILNADVNLQDSDGNTPAHRIILSLTAYPELGTTEVFTLLQASAIMNFNWKIQNKEGLSAVAIAIKQPSAAVLETLLITNSRSLDINNPDSLGCYPLHFAAATGSAKIVQYLLGSGVTTSIKDQNGLLASELLVNTYMNAYNNSVEDNITYDLQDTIYEFLHSGVDAKLIIEMIINQNQQALLFNFQDQKKAEFLKILSSNGINDLDLAGVTKVSVGDE